jgi:phenylpyruvate tautomerase PptA (4-oxalocrotonate tautomerase family)
MPFIHIKSMPLTPEIDIPSTIKVISDIFSKHMGIGTEHITVTWDYFKPWHYIHSNEACEIQSANSHPVIVDMLAPDFHSGNTIEKMLKVVADSLSKNSGVPIDNIFINYREAHSGMVFDNGDIVRW